ncbi:hypothetical protein [Phycisphaera mikurensis]|uniref:Uncharacterized protein n=1 Tax=Phycisphaera mikurensis (strain NBRC 102666 / KCTC 22515 / FYK2301M01) TaxID=1142394 RepID=I0ICF9_PHYMF|nr:hypothetical protein [Phycisphaera mikurensis]MBB6442177.1 hypothetical protein [Phycisphaera mikurensis]BAM02947.1 hypothetical protein PSMK_07880 [Phycisphaera mikurensis NBRC 102666]
MKTLRSPHAALALALVVLVAWAAGSPCAAQQAEPAEPGGLRIDLEALLTDPRVVATTLEDPVWSLALEPGASLFQVPVIAEPGGDAVRLERPAAGLDGAALLAWSVPAPDEAAAGAGGPPAAATPQPPRVARELRLGADGTVSWEAERMGREFEASASGGRAGSLYAYLVAPDVLRGLRPEAPPRAVPGGDRDAARAAADLYRAQRDEYRALQDAVAALPTRVEQPLPDRLWLVYERRRPDAPLVFEERGRGRFEVGVEAFEALRAMAGGPGGPGGRSGVASAVPLPPERLVRAGDGLGNLLVATAAGRALAGAGSGGREAAAENAAAVALAEAVIDRGDVAAVRRLIRELAQAVPPTPTTVRLLAAAAPRAGGFGQLASLRARMMGLATGPAGVPDLEAGRAAAELQALLEDPDGPAPAEVVETLIDAAAERPALAEAAAAAVRPASLPPERLRAFVDAVLAAAVRRPAASADGRRPGADAASGYAATLLDRTLLRSFTPAVVGAALAALEDAGGGDSRVSPWLARLRAAVSGDPADAAPRPAGVADRPPLRIPAGALALDRPDHGLIQQLRSGDPAVRAAAGRALRLFRLGGGGTGPAAADPATLDALLLAAGDVPPPGLVVLLARSPDTDPVNTALLRLLGGAPAPAASRVLQRLLGSERALDGPLTGLEPEAQAAVAAAALRAASGAAETPAAGLVLDRRGAAAVAEGIASGRPPDAAALARAVGDEDALLRLADDPDPRLAAGARAGLAAAAGADAAGQAAAVAAMSEGGATPAEAWPAIRDRLRLAQLARAAGAYRLVVTTGPAGPEAGATGTAAARVGAGPVAALPGLGDAAGGEPAENAATRVRRIDLGVIVLEVTDEGLRIAGDPLRLTLAPDRPAIRLNDPLELAIFPSEEIASVPLAAAEGPLDLTETASGWRGGVPLGLGGTLGLEMIRVAE